MSKIAIKSSSSGTATFTIESPATNTDRTLVLPDVAGVMYAQGNIVGTVSQSGGVPTGAIIESGSNANGEFVKYADGTMICSVRGLTVPRPTANNIMETEWVFPVSFTNITNLSTSMSIRNNAANFVGFTGWNAEQVRQRMTSSFANTSIGTTSVLIGQNFDQTVPSGATLTDVCAAAIGRWF